MPFNLKKIASFLNITPQERGGVIGIDIGSSSLKIVQLKEVRGSAVLETYGELQLGPYAQLEVGRATNLEPSRLSEALVDLVREASVTSRNGALAVPFASSFVTVIRLPPTDESKLASMIPIEARKYVPVPISEVTLDWFVIPDKLGAEGQKTETRVLLAAIHNEALSRYRSAVRDANLLSSFNEIEVFSTIRSSVVEQNDTVMIIDIGAATTKLYIVSGGMVQATHSITLGGQDMTLALSQSLELSVGDAEELKRQVGLDTEQADPRIGRALDFALERLLSESRRVLERYERTNGAPVRSIVLSGGGAALRNLAAHTEAALKRPVALANPFAKVEYPAFLEDTLKEIGPSFAVAVGVALRRLSER